MRRGKAGPREVRRSRFGQDRETQAPMKIPGSLGSTAFCAALLLCACVGGQNAGSGPRPIVDANTAITLDRSVCYGFCPSYSIRIGGDGTVAYVGRQFVKVVGTASSQVPLSDVQGLANEMEQANYFDLTVPETCAQGISTDFPTATTSLTLAGATHTIERYQGNACAPAVLTTLEDRIDTVANSAQWVKCDTADGYCAN